MNKLMLTLAVAVEIVIGYGSVNAAFADAKFNTCASRKVQNECAHLDT